MSPPSRQPVTENGLLSLYNPEPDCLKRKLRTISYTQFRIDALYIAFDCVWSKIQHTGSIFNAIAFANKTNNILFARSKVHLISSATLTIEVINESLGGCRRQSRAIFLDTLQVADDAISILIFKDISFCSRLERCEQVLVIIVNGSHNDITRMRSRAELADDL